jgi:hypothetical protein
LKGRNGWEQSEVISLLAIAMKDRKGEAPHWTGPFAEDVNRYGKSVSTSEWQMPSFETATLPKITLFKSE